MDDLLARLRAAAPAARVYVDDFGDVVVALRRDLTHLDADAMSDRLQEFSLRLLRASPNLSALVSFDHARAADDSEEEADLEALWKDVEARLVLHAGERAPAAERAAFVAKVPEFLALVERAGRPAGWRDVASGTPE